MDTLMVQGEISSRIFTLRGEQVMLDRDLAELYGVTTKRLNEQVKRNRERFPSDFMFQLDEKEKSELVAKCDRFKTLKHSTANPYAFTEQGIYMLASVLKSDTAVAVNIVVFGHVGVPFMGTLDPKRESDNNRREKGNHKGLPLQRYKTSSVRFIK